MAEKVSVFISHHHSPEEDAFTDRLKDDLEKAGAEVWIDTDAILRGSFMTAINQGLISSRWLVLIMTPEALHSPFVKDEVEAALIRVNKGHMRAVIPIVVKNCNESDIPPTWTTLQRYDATQDYGAALLKLLYALELLAPPITPPPPSEHNKEEPKENSGHFRQPRTIVVDANGHGQFRTIAAAIAIARPDDHILVRLGTYHEPLTVDKPIEIRGDKGNGQWAPTIVTPATKGFAIRVAYAQGVRFESLSVRIAGGDADAVVVEKGAQLELVDCDVSASRDGRSGVWVKDRGTLTLQGGDVHDCGFNGVVLEGASTNATIIDGAYIRDCGARLPSRGVSSAGLHVKQGATVTMTSSFVQNNRNAHAVHVESGGFGEFTNNDLRGNTLASWSPNTKPPRMNIKESGNLVDNGTQ